LREALEEQVEKIDFADFWDGVTSKLTEARLPWTVRLQLWRERWWPDWSLSTSAWGAAAALLLIVTALLLSLLRPPHHIVPLPAQPEPFELAANDQAQIESLSATDTVLVWNEPASNATVIWVSDESDGGLP
jgi:hypothetical protein